MRGTIVPRPGGLRMGSNRPAPAVYPLPTRLTLVVLAIVSNEPRSSTDEPQQRG